MMASHEATVPQSMQQRLEFELDAPQSMPRFEASNCERNFASKEGRKRWELARLLLSEICTCYLRIKFLRERTSRSRFHTLDLCCQSCRAVGFCCAVLDHYMLHMQALF